MKLGPTGKHPDGKLCEHDEGQIRIAVGLQRGKVVLDFGTRVTWLGMDPETAEAVAKALLEHAAAAKRARS